MELYQLQCLASLALKEDLTEMSNFAKRIGYTRSYLYKVRRKPLTQNFIESVELNIGKNLTSKGTSSELHTINDSTEIVYWEKCSDFGAFTKTPKIRSVWDDKEIIKGYWYTLSKNIRLIRIFDDRMVTKDGLMQEDAIVELDITQTDYTNGGVFLYSAKINNFKILRIARIAIRPFEGVVVFSWNNSEKYQPKYYTFEELKEKEFKIHARVLHDRTHLIR